MLTKIFHLSALLDFSPCIISLVLIHDYSYLALYFLQIQICVHFLGKLKIEDSLKYFNYFCLNNMSPMY